MHPVIKLISAAALLALGGCASQTASRMGAAAASPLTDLGFRKEDIPAVLAKAQENPYLMPAATHADTCLACFSAPLSLRTQLRKGIRPSAVRCTAPTAWSSATSDALSMKDSLFSTGGAS